MQALVKEAKVLRGGIYAMKCANVMFLDLILGMFVIGVGVELYSDLRCEKFFFLKLYLKLLHKR